MDERIKTLVKSGMNEKDAFEKATTELGDISAVADEISRKKKQEILGEMYMKTRHYRNITSKNYLKYCCNQPGKFDAANQSVWFHFKQEPGAKILENSSWIF